MDTQVLDWSVKELRQLPEGFGQLTALTELDLSRRSACANVWAGTWRCVAFWRRCMEMSEQRARRPSHGSGACVRSLAHGS